MAGVESTTWDLSNDNHLVGLQAWYSDTVIRSLQAITLNMTCIREDKSKLKNETIGGGAPPTKNSTVATLTPKKEQVTEKVKEEPI